MNLFEAASALECGPEGMEHLSELPSQGMHVLLLASEPTACEAAGGTALRLKVYADGVASDEPSALELPCDLDDAALEPLLSELRGKVEAARPLVHARLLRERKLSRDSAKHSRQSADARLEDWRFYSPFGSELRSPASLLSALLQCRAAYVFEGGAWVWPGIRVGHRRVLQSTSQSGGAESTLVAMTTQALQPLVFLVEPLLSEDECEWIMRGVEPSMERSVVAHVSETDADRAWDAEKRRERRLQAEQSRNTSADGTQRQLQVHGD